MRSFSQLYIMSVFGVKYRLGLIASQWDARLYAVIATALNKIEGVRALEVGGDQFHVHMLYSTRGKVAELEIMRRVKIDSTKWINENKLTTGRFGWQDGGGNFSYSQSQLESVKAYIRNQKEHHRVKTFREEYEELLHRFDAEITPYSLPDDPQ